MVATPQTKDTCAAHLVGGAFHQVRNKDFVMIISYDGIASLRVSAGEDPSDLRRLHTIAFIKLRSEYPTGLGLVDFVGHSNRPTGFKHVQICTSAGPSLSVHVIYFGAWQRGLDQVRGR